MSLSTTTRSILLHIDQLLINGSEVTTPASSTNQERGSSPALIAALQELQSHVGDNPLGAQLIANFTRLLASEDDWEQSKEHLRGMIRYVPSLTEYVTENGILRIRNL